MEPSTPALAPRRTTARSSTDLLNSDAKTGTDTIAHLAALICDTPISLVRVVDGEQHVSKSVYGATTQYASFIDALCARTVSGPDFLHVPDTTRDARFRNGPNAARVPAIRFFAGAPNTSPTGHAVGAIYVVDNKPRELSESQRDVLQLLAQLVMQQLTTREASHLSDNRIQRLIDTLPVMIAYVDKEQRYRFVNQTYTEHFSRPRSAIIGTAVASLLGNSYEDARKYIEKALSGEAIRYEMSVPLSDGGATHKLVQYEPHLDPDGGESIGFCCVITDITERKQMESALVELKERAEVTLESIGDAVIAADGSGRVNYMNPVAQVLTSWSQTLAAGRPVDEVFTLINEESRRPVQNPILVCLQEGRVVTMDDETQLVSRHGKEYAIQNPVAPIRDRDGKVVGAVAVFSDVSDARDLQRAINHQARHDELTGLFNRRA